MPEHVPASFVPAIHCHQQSKDDAPHAAHHDAAHAAPKKKKIFVFCDGTGNEFVASRSDTDANSNVVKLYTTLRVADDQVAYYHPGVGTMGDPSIRSYTGRLWSKLKGLAFGAGFKTNVMDAYRYLMDTYNDGDDIYLFGFSRGSYTARSLAGMLHGYGLLCKGNEGHIEYAWNMFCNELTQQRNLLKQDPKSATSSDRHGRVRSHSIKRNRAFAETYSRDVTIRFMGLWDTVSSVGWIYAPLRLLDMAQNPIVEVGRHAVSIDERRAYYRDNLWGDPVAITDPRRTALGLPARQQDIVQVWFPGAHSDVGGSYPQAEAAPANEALRWMIGELQNHGAQLCQERIDMVLGKPSGIYTADDIYAPPPESGKLLHNSLKGSWWLLQLFPQQHYNKEDEKIQWRVPYGTPRTIPRKAIIHKSAVDRMDDKSAAMPYRPRNLERVHLQPLTTPPFPTTANLEGCFLYEPGRHLRLTPAWSRIPKLIVGWITAALFWGGLAAIACALILLILCGILLAASTLLHCMHALAARYCLSR